MVATTTVVVDGHALRFKHACKHVHACISITFQSQQADSTKKAVCLPTLHIQTAHHKANGQDLL
jgi:hypothetical protein